MYSLLVVDDEKFAVQGITRGIDWSELQIETIFEAYDCNEAMDILKRNYIDVVISDVEMPGLNGIKLLEWINENLPNTKVIFLSGHAEFAYAQKALQLGSFDYLLKPADHKQLKQLVAAAMEKGEKEKEIKNSSIEYQKYLRMWEENLPVMIQNFWMEVIEDKHSSTPEKVETLLSQYKIPLTLQDKIIPVLISIEDWKGDFSAKEEDVMIFAVESAINHILLSEFQGTIIRDYFGTILVLLHNSRDKLIEINEFRDLCSKKCKELIELCDEHYFSAVSCYIGEPSEIFSLSETCSGLLHMENGNIKSRQRVFLQSQMKVEITHSNLIPWFADWYILFEIGKKNELMQKIKILFENLEAEDRVNRETLESIYYGINYMLYYTISKKNIKTIEGSKNITFEEAVRSITKLKKWVMVNVSAYFDAISTSSKYESVLIDKVKQYINEHICEEFSREDIARSVYLNPAYLSRIFKFETGISLSDYTTELRMKKAKVMLEDSSFTVSSIAEELCYFNFSHFSKMFKKYTGVTPSEYRKMHHIEVK
jgi:two-component system response regulator YesN